MHTAMIQSKYNPNDAENLILVFIEQESGKLEPVSLEMLSRGREMAEQMGWSIIGFLAGHRLGDLSKEVIAYGAGEVWVAEHELLDNFTIEAFTHTLHEVILQNKPSVLLVGATPNGRDLAGRLAVRLRTGLNADSTDLRMNPENGVMISEVSGFGGGVLALIEMQNHRPQMATVRPGVFEAQKPDYERQGNIAYIDINLNENMIQTKIIERVVGDQIDLSQAPVLIAGGRGVDGNFRMMQELADILGGEVGATRPPVDEGHIDRERQIGQTGIVCSPNVAICCGISGAFHFIVGIEKAETVIAINSDTGAPIFDHADYCVIEDVNKIIPKLIQALAEKG